MPGQKELGATLHFYQPGREGLGLDVVPFINERIYQESYRPILVEPETLPAGTIFSLYAPLREWITRFHPQEFNQLKQKIRRLPNKEYWVLGDPLIHTILPFGDETDVDILVKAGKMAFIDDLGFTPKGIWLPETAISVPVLEVLSRNGYEFVPLMDHQVDSWPTNPVEIPLSGGRKIAVLRGDSGWSNAMAFHPEEYVNGEEFLRHVRGADTGEVLFFNDGETFGHHHKGKQWFINYTLNAQTMKNNGVQPLDAPSRFDKKRRMGRANIWEKTAWSCPHQLGRWTGNCDCDGAGKSARQDKREYYGKLMGYKAWIKSELNRLSPGWYKWFPGLLAGSRHYLFGTPGGANEVDYLGEGNEVKRLCQGLMMVYVGMTSCGWFFGGDSSIERQIPEKMIKRLDEMFGSSR